LIVWQACIEAALILWYFKSTLILQLLYSHHFRPNGVMGKAKKTEQEKHEFGHT
jgi:hypothetical protein